MLILKKPPLQLKKLGIKPARTRKDPLAHIQPTGDVEKDSAQETSAILTAVKAADAAEKHRFEDTTDSEYWVNLVFQSRAQKEAFLKAMNWLQHGDKYIDGQVLARQQGIALPASGVRFTPESSKLDDLETISNLRG